MHTRDKRHCDDKYKYYYEGEYFGQCTCKYILCNVIWNTKKNRIEYKRICLFILLPPNNNSNVNDAWKEVVSEMRYVFAI